MDQQNDIPKRFKSAAAFLKRGPANGDSLGLASPGLGGMAHKVRRNLEDMAGGITIRRPWLTSLIGLFSAGVPDLQINLGATKPLEDPAKRNFTSEILTAQDASLIDRLKISLSGAVSCREKSRPGNCAWLR